MQNVTILLVHLNVAVCLDTLGMDLTVQVNYRINVLNQIIYFSKTKMQNTNERECVYD